MWRNWRPSFSRHRRGGSAARSRPRSDAVNFRKRNRRSGAFRPHKFPSSRNCRRSGCPRHFRRRFFGFLRRFYESLSLCRSIYRKFKPQVVLGMGGFTSTAPVLAGRMRGIPTFIHESNAIPGKANRLTARMVRAVMLGFKECAPFFPKAHTEITGTPIRTELKRLDRQVARQKLGLREDLPTLLVMGGSQGASGINQAMIKSLPFLQGVPAAGDSSFRRARRTSGCR